MTLSYPSDLHELQQRTLFIEQALQYGFCHKPWLLQAFTHSSYLNEYKFHNLQSNERLEFLGDAILGALVTKFLFERFPTMSEGDLSQLRAQMVDASTCARHVDSLGLGSCLLMGRGQRMGTHLHSLKADLFEAILGAIYLDGGWSGVEEFFWKHFTDALVEMGACPPRNWKALLQDILQKKLQLTPTYQVLSEEGPDHTKAFEVGIFVSEHCLAKGIGNSKKTAQQDAAREGFILLEKEPALWQTLSLFASKHPGYGL